MILDFWPNKLFQTPLNFSCFPDACLVAVSIRAWIHISTIRDSTIIMYVSIIMHTRYLFPTFFFFFFYHFTLHHYFAYILYQTIHLIIHSLRYSHNNFERKWSFIQETSFILLIFAAFSWTFNASSYAIINTNLK